MNMLRILLDYVKRLNPCSNGITIELVATLQVHRAPTGLNPCSNGITIESVEEKKNLPDDTS